jgi:predicted amidohydrolase YtcJ
MNTNKFIITAKKIYTLDDNSTIYSTMLVEDGKIKELSNSPLPYKLEKIDYSDRYIVPGFIDSHTHILGTGLQLVFPDVSSAQSFEELFDKISDASNIAQEHGFLVVYNFDPDNLKEHRYPHRRELDRVLKDYPILLYRIDGHSGVLNTMGLEQVLETHDKTLEQGIEYDEQKEPIGILRGKAYEFTSRFFTAKFSKELRKLAFEKACILAIKHGVTLMVTMLGTEVDNISCELLLQVQDKLPIEVIPFYQTKDINRVKKLNLPRIGGCILIDGSFGSHTAALIEDYTDEPKNKGVLYLTDEELTKFYRESDTNGLQTAVHAIGDRAIEQVVRCFETFLKDNRLRHRIEHCELLNDDLIKRIRDLGLVTCVQPAFEHYWGGPDKIYKERLGERWQKTNPLKQLHEAGIIVAAGSDSPITLIDPLLGIKSAVNHPNPAHRISPLQALEMFTKNGTYAICAENRIGQLKENYQADFVVLDKDPMENIPNQINAVYKKGKNLF